MTIVRTATAALLTTVLVLSAVPHGASANTFEVKGPEIEKGESEVTVNTATRFGLHPGGDDLRGAIDLNASYGFTDWLKIGLKASTHIPDGEAWRLATVGIEHQLSFGKLAPGIAWGWYGGVDVRVHKDLTHAVVMGPIVQFGDDKLSATFNTFIQKTFGANHEQGVDFVYAAGLKGRIREGLALGIEAHGVLPDIGHGTPVALQDHRIGPVVYIEREVSPKRGDRGATRLQLEIGAFVGLTETTPDWTGKLKASLVW